jgi:hypothetical protein
MAEFDGTTMVTEHSPMKLTASLALAAILAAAPPARAERPDCAHFPDTHSRFACYDNVSRAPPDPAVGQSLKPDAGTTKAATTRGRKARSN